MQTSKLNSSIYIIWTFILLTIFQHIAVILKGPDALISHLSLAFIIFIAIIFWVQFYLNFKNYLKIGDIHATITRIVICDIVLLMVNVMYTLDSADLVTSNLDQTSNNILEGVTLTFRLILLIYNVQLGLRLYNQKDDPEIRNLGLSLILRMIATIGTAYFKTNATLKPIYHIFILFEVLPWWYTYIIYRKIMISENLH